MRTAMTFLLLALATTGQSVRVDAHGWIDYMHLVKENGDWKIVNVLWEMRRP